MTPDGGRPRSARARTQDQPGPAEERRPAPARAALVLATAVLLAFLPAGGAARTLYVDDVGDGAPGTGSAADPYRGLQAALDAAEDGDVIEVLPGIYAASPVAFVEPLCGNCIEHRTPVRATRGFLIAGKTVDVRGSGAGETTLVTNAGYGVLLEGCPRASLSDLRITGGVRDADGNATDAAVVVRESTVTLSGLELVDNAHRLEDVVVGIGGIMGREGSLIFVLGNTIRGNGWDGVALYRGAVATIAGNEITEGRGAGVGITWDASATVLGNRVSRYWKGIGTFGSSRAVVRNNAVFDNLGWGVIATGTSFLEASNNVIVRNGNCGFALWSEDAAAFLSSNIIAENGWREEWVCPRVGVWLNGDREDLDARCNDVWANVEGNYRDVEDLTGAFGNISLDPGFVDSLDFRLGLGSPAVDSGDTLFTDPDAGPADIGMYGGPGSHSFTRRARASDPKERAATK